MPVSKEKELTPEEQEKGPKPNGDLGSWLYVLGGIPCMILFFLLGKRSGKKKSAIVEIRRV